MQEATITPIKITEFTFGDNKTGWNISVATGEKYACFSSTEIKKLAEGVASNVKFVVVERNGYENRNIKQVAGPDGQFEQKAQSSGGGGKVGKADPDKLRQDKELEIARNKSIQRQVAAKAATEIANFAGGVESSRFWTHWDEAYEHILTKLLEAK